MAGTLNKEGYNNSVWKTACYLVQGSQQQRRVNTDTYLSLSHLDYRFFQEKEIFIQGPQLNQMHLSLSDIWGRTWGNKDEMCLCCRCLCYLGVRQFRLEHSGKTGGFAGISQWLNGPPGLLWLFQKETTPFNKLRLNNVWNEFININGRPNENHLIHLDFVCSVDED